MATMKAPPFGPSRVPPMLTDPIRPAPTNRDLSIEEAHERLGRAWASFDRARFDPDGCGPLHRAEAGCEHGCPRCPLACSIILGVLTSMWRDYQTTLEAAGPVLSFGGAVYSAMAGRA